MKPHETAIDELKHAINENEEIFVVHYSCESWFDVKNQPVAISCVAVVDLIGDNSTTFSQVDRKDSAEEYVLKSYFDFLRKNCGARIIHWKMNSADFGFRALEHRFRYISSPDDLPHPSHDRTYDLNRIISGRYGSDYADHPRLLGLGKLNRFVTRHLLTGKEEAERFGQGNHGDIKRSTLEKANLIAFLAKRTIEGILETKHSAAFLAFAGAHLDPVHIAISLGEKFRDVERQLKVRRKEGGAPRPTIEITDEYDAQDLYHSLLRVFFDDIRPEDPTPETAGKHARIDFVLPKHGIAVELKHSRKSLTHKELGDELIVDVERYSKRHDVRHITCLVFDYEGQIQNPRGIEKDLSRVHDGNLPVTVRIFDR